MNEYLPDFFEYLEEALREERGKTINPVIEFAKFLYLKSQKGELESDYDDFTIDDFISETENLKSEIHRWPEDNNTVWLEKISPNRWGYKSSSNQNSTDVFSSSSLESKPNDIRKILEKNASNIDEDELDKLRDHVKELKSKDKPHDNDRETIAEISYLIANVSFNVDKTDINAGEWFEAGYSLAEIDSTRACQCFRKASELYSILLKHSESADSLDEALSLRDYDKLDAKEKKVYRKDLVDCQVQYSRAGQNDKSSEKYVESNDLKSAEMCWLLKSFYWLFKVTSKYGESPTKVLVSALITILFSTFIYSCFGIKSGIDQYGNPILERDFWTGLYFSFVTFTTLGYGDYSPVGFVRLIATLQALSGLILTSLFMVTLVRKHSR